MARRNARVILACRNLTKGSNLKRRVVTETGNNKIEVYELDVSSMESVRNFVTRFNKEESRCDVLINNAGVTGMYLCTCRSEIYSISVKGLEYTKIKFNYLTYPRLCLSLLHFSPSIMRQERLSKNLNLTKFYYPPELRRGKY